MVTLALKKHKGDPIAAIEDLLAHEGIIEGISLEDEGMQTYYLYFISKVLRFVFICAKIQKF